MQRSNVGWRMAGGAVAAGVAVAAAVMGSPAPAYAGGEDPFREQATSLHNGGQIKSVTVDCPDGTFVFAAGGKINNGGGGVVLTRVVPTAHSVTAAGVARSGYGGDWSVTAFAICDESDTAPVPAVDTANSDTAMATCDPGLRVFGTGFRLDGPVDHAFLNEVAPDPTLRHVRVHAGGVGATSLTAIGICHSRATPMGRMDATVDLAGTFPQQVIAENDSPDVHVYGVGGRVTGSPGAFLDALIPDVEADQAGVQVARVGAPGGAQMLFAGDGDEGSGTAYGIRGGTFH